MTKTLKTTLKGSALAFTFLSFVGCGNDDNTATTNTVTVPATTINGVTVEGTPSSNVTADAETRTFTITATDGTVGTITYRAPKGVVVSNTSGKLYTIPKDSVLFTGTVDQDNVKITVNGTEYTDKNLVNKNLTVATAIALPAGTYSVNLPKVNINGGLAVDNFIIKGIVVDANGASNFVKSIDASTLPAVGSSVASTNLGFKLDTLAVGKAVALSIKSGDKTYQKSAIVDTDGKINFSFVDDSAEILGAVSSVTLDLGS